MQTDRFYQLLDFLRASSEENELVEVATKELLTFYSSPESFLFLTEQYKICTDIYFKKGILLSISKALALNIPQIPTMDPKYFEFFLNNLVQILIDEKDSNFSKEIAELIQSTLQVTRKSWPSLIACMQEFPTQNIDTLFYLLSNIILLDEEEPTIREDLISRALTFIKQAEYEQWKLSDKLSALTFLTNLIIKFGHSEIIPEFAPYFILFYSQLIQTKEMKLLNPSLFILDYINVALQSSEFSESVCPVLQLIDFCLNNEINNSDYIQIREYINRVIKYSQNPEPEFLIHLIQQTFLLSQKIFSKEIDVQTKEIDDFFPLLKKIPFQERCEFSQSAINELIKQSDASFYCTALSIYQGAIMSGINFDNHALDFFFAIFDGIDHFGVRNIALSTLSDIAGIITVEIESNIDKLISCICTYLQYLAEQSVDIRIEYSFQALEAMFSITDLYTNFSPECYPLFFETSTQYIQNGIEMEQHGFLTLISNIIQYSSEFATQEQTILFLFECLNNPDNYLRSIVYDTFVVYIYQYPQVIPVDDILKVIENEQDPICFGGIASICGDLAMAYKDEIKEYVLSKLDFIFSLLNIPEDADIAFLQQYGAAIMSLLHIMSSYELYQPLEKVIESLSIFIKHNFITGVNHNNINRGLQNFFKDANTDFSVFLPLFQSIKELFESNPDHNLNIYLILTTLVENQEISDIPEIDFLTISAIMSFLKLVQNEAKENENFIADVSEFIRLVYTNYTSQNIMSPGKSLVEYILRILSNEQAPFLSSTENQMYYILASILPKEGYFNEDLYKNAIPFLVNKLNESTNPTCCKTIAYSFKCLCGSQEKLIANEYIGDTMTALIGRLVSESELPSFALLNDNIISALISIQSTYNAVDINEFFKSIEQFLPCITDEDEFTNIYPALIYSYPYLTPENQTSLTDILIKFLAHKSSGSFIDFFTCSEESQRDLMTEIRWINSLYAIIGNKLSQENQNYLSELLQQNEESIQTFKEHLTYISQLIGVQAND